MNISNINRNSIYKRFICCIHVWKGQGRVLNRVFVWRSLSLYLILILPDKKHLSKSINPPVVFFRINVYWFVGVISYHTFYVKISLIGIFWNILSWPSLSLWLFSLIWVDEFFIREQSVERLLEAAPFPNK